MADAPRRPSFPKFFLAIVCQFVYPILVVGLGGDWRWGAGWAFGLWFSGFCLATLSYLYVRDPALLAERSRRPGTGGEPTWDRVALVAITVLFMAWFVLMPLDARRFHWTAGFPVAWQVLGGVLLLLGSFFMFRAVADNTFASAMVRIQAERGQQVVSSGVYRLVRHPMYLGATAMTLGAPLLLGSRWGLALGLLIIAVLALRILGEERLLADQLEGYDDYRKQVRYRLFPGVW